MNATINATVFSDREVQIINLLVEGFSNLEIAEIMSLHESTVEGIRKTMLKKACDRDMIALVRLILKAGWLR